MRILSIANQKGGCGKTTTAVNLSHAMALLNKKILLIDLDPQHHTSTYLGYHNATYTILNIIDNVTKNVVFEIESYMQKRNDNLYVIPAEMELSAVEQELASAHDAVNVLKNTLAKVSQRFDYCIIDCPPGLGFLTLNALNASDSIIVPFESSVFSLMGAEQLNKIVKMIAEVTHRAPEVKHLLTMFDRRSYYAKNFMNDARARFGQQMFNCFIRTNTDLREAAMRGRTIFEHDPESHGAEDYTALAQEILVRSDNTKAVDFKVTGFDQAQKVYLTGDFNNWQIDEQFSLTRAESGTWQKRVPLQKGTYRYKFVVDNQWITDPQNPNLENDAFGGRNSLIELQ